MVAVATGWEGYASPLACAKMHKIKSNLSLYSLDYAEACNELAGTISASLRPGNTASFEEMSQRWRAVGNNVSDLTGPRFEPQTSRSKDERVSARPTGWFAKMHNEENTTFFARLRQSFAVI